MKYFILYIFNWFIVMFITYFLYSLKHYDILSYIGGIVTTLILFFSVYNYNK